ncbi:MAG: hypothetical protein B7Z61_08180, partial [Acidobacteria bacterium 37-71-11]
NVLVGLGFDLNPQLRVADLVDDPPVSNAEPKRAVLTAILTAPLGRGLVASASRRSMIRNLRVSSRASNVLLTELGMMTA